MGSVQKGGGISGFGIANEDQTPLSGTGGAAGAGTRAGEGQPSGEDIGASSADSLGDRSDDEVAREAAAIGTSNDDHDRTPALEYGEGDRPVGGTIGEALGSGAGSDVGSGTPPDQSGLGGAGGSTSSGGVSSPGGNNGG